MKKTTIIVLIIAGLYAFLPGQVPDSTFGVPDSFEGFPGTYWPGVTGCDFDGRDDRCYSALHLDDGRIVLAGHTHGNDGTDFALVRLLHDGQYDLTAGPKGQIRIDLGYSADSCLAAALYPGDMIIMGGCTKLPGQTGYVNLVARVDLDGLPDPAFGNNGHLVIDLPSAHEMVTKVITIPDGRIIIAGNAFFGPSFSFPDSTSVFIGRLLPDGQVDSTFGVNGFLFLRFEQACRSSLLGDIILDNEDRILVSGGSYSPYPGVYNLDDWCTHNINLCRYLPDGQPDPSLGGDGIVEMPVTEGRATALHIDDNGKILVAGIITDLLLTYPAYTLFARMWPDGAPDSSFAVDGRFVKFILGPTNSSEPVGILKIDGKYYLGYVDNADGDHHAFGLIRFTESGVLDTSFGQNGVFNSWAWLPFGGHIRQISSTDPQGILLTGTYRTITFRENMMISKVKLAEMISATRPEMQLELIVFPNPVREGKVYFKYSGPASEGPATVRLSDMQGRRSFCREIFLAQGLNEIEIPALPDGLYVLELIGRNFRHGGKLAVQR
jgi:uncharacterized delta-60 repeat protein